MTVGLRAAGAAVIAAAGLFGRPAASQEGVADAFAVAGWEGAAMFEDDDFTHCVMVHGIEGGATLRFSIDVDGRFIIGIDDPAWHEAADRQPPPLRLRIDGAGPFEAEPVLSEGEVSAVFDADSDLQRRLRAGNALDAELGDLSTSLSLAGTGQALPALDRCAARYR